MFRISRSAAAALVLFAFAAGLVVVNAHVSRGKLPRAEALTRVASAQVLVFLPSGGQPAGYLDGRPVPSGLTTPIIVHWRGGDAGNIVVAQTASLIP
jgi:hypothetical protein